MIEGSSRSNRMHLDASIRSIREIGRRMQKTAYRAWFFLCISRWDDTRSFPASFIARCLASEPELVVQLAIKRAQADAIWKPHSREFSSWLHRTKVQWFRADTFRRRRIPRPSDPVFIASTHTRPETIKSFVQKKAAMTRSETTRRSKEQGKKKTGVKKSGGSVAFSERVSRLIKDKARIPAERQDRSSEWSSSAEPKVNASVYFWPLIPKLKIARSM